jgi:phosphinothricin acetyltransferase
VAAALVNVDIRPMVAADGASVARIFEHGIATKNATFETSAPTWDAFEAGHVACLSFVAVTDERVVGWVACTPYSSRHVYRGVVEESLYIDETTRGQGIGRALLVHFLDAADSSGIWTVQAGIFPENTASIALHESLGFRIIARRERLGEMDGRWRDVLLLERRVP